MDHRFTLGVEEEFQIVDPDTGELRSHVRHEFRGVATCTHLNDALRALGDLWSLVDLLDP